MSRLSRPMVTRRKKIARQIRRYGIGGARLLDFEEHLTLVRLFIYFLCISLCGEVVTLYNVSV